MSGLLVLVVGPSGAGKDTLLAGAARALATDSRFRFVRRVVTRPAAGEDHDVTDVMHFLARRDAGDFALHWEAHGLHYGIPANIADDLTLGRVVVANVSRGVLSEAAARFPAVAIEVTAPDEVRAARLRNRGREAPADIIERLTRKVERPEGLAVLTIVNDGSVADGIAAFVNVLTRMTAEACPLDNVKAGAP
jgi:ribose 1,5-bisphosphokinase